MSLGKQQLCLLATMGSPFTILLVSDKLSRSLVRRHLLAPHFLKSDAGLGVTPAGLRALADALERDRFEQFKDPHFRRDTARLYIDTKAVPVGAGFKPAPTPDGYEP